MKCPNCDTELKVVITRETIEGVSIEFVLRRMRILTKEDKKERNIYFLDKTNPAKFAVTYGGIPLINRLAINKGLSSGLIKEVVGYPGMQYFEPTAIRQHTGVKP